MKLPLDLDDIALLSDKETFQRQVRHLDPDGWDMDARLHSSSLLRVRMMVALIRDEILEVMLDPNGNYAIDDITYEKPPKLLNYWCRPADEPYNRKLKRKELELYTGLPAHVVCSPKLEEIRDINLQMLYPRLLIRLDHLLNIFLVERLLVKHGHPRSDLLRSSFEMIVLTLHFWTQKHIWAVIQGEWQWIVSHSLLPTTVSSMSL